MARYKYIDTQPRLRPVDLAQQLMPGTFAQAVHHWVAHAIYLSHFDARFKDDTTGALVQPRGRASGGVVPSDLRQLRLAYRCVPRPASGVARERGTLGPAMH
ncbi:MAG: hypothetical protein IT361_03755 [Gemmatimonadaceae bacterium]|nr:hypothetical protein [Gemmatimonadaceae bacterium]